MRLQECCWQVEGEVVSNSRNFTKPPQVLFLGSVQVDRQDKERSHSWQYIAMKVNEWLCNQHACLSEMVGCPGGLIESK